jgi:hypothetical protein
MRSPKNSRIVRKESSWVHWLGSSSTAETVQRYSPNETGTEEHRAMSGAHVVFAVVPYTTRARSPGQPRQIRVPFHEAARCNLARGHGD